MKLGIFQAGRPKDRDLRRFLLLAAIVALVALLGGSSRADAFQENLLRPALVVFITVTLIMNLDDLDWRPIRALLILLGGLAAAIAIQLVPLPFAVPAHGHIGDLPAGAGIAASAQPVSLSPDRTWNSLLALLVPLAMLIGYQALSPRHRKLVVPVLLAVASLSALFGVFQFLGGETSSLYPYEFSNRGLPIGFFANSNHQAAMLAMCLPLLHAYALTACPSRSSISRSRSLIALAVALFLGLMILMTGSRTGLLLLFVGIAMAVAVNVSSFTSPSESKFTRYLKLLLVVVFVGVLLLAWKFGRALSIDRLLLTNSGQDDPRFQNMPSMLEMLRNGMPFGSGFGSFDRVFPAYEYDSVLQASYLNNAHNDLLELAITGGVPALLVLVAFVLWWARASFRVFRARTATQSIYIGRAAAAAILMLCLASLTDYPLRTPLLGATFALLAAMLANAGPEARRTGNAMVATASERH